MIRGGRSGGPAGRSPRARARPRALAVGAGARSARGAGPKAGPRRRPRGALRDGLGRAAARSGPLRRRLRAQAAVEARPRAPGAPVHPHALRVRLPLRPGAGLATSHPFHKGRSQPRNRMALDEEQPILLALAVAARWPSASPPAVTTRSRPPAARAAESTTAASCRARSRSTAPRRSAPFAEAAAELFQEENPDVQVTVGTSGTGGGFEKFCAGETDISDASRPIKDDEEAPVCEKAGVEVHRGPDRQRRHRGRDEQGARGRLPDDRPAQAGLEQGLQGHLARRGRPEAARHRAVALRPGHRLRHVRLLHRRRSTARRA